MPRFAITALAVVHVFSAPHLVCADNEGEARFINAYLQAHGAKDLEGVFRLFSERPGAEMEERLRVVLNHSFGAPIKKIELVPEKPDPKEAANAGKGKKQHYFKVTHNLVIHFPENAAIGYTLLSFPAGSKDGRLYLAPVSPGGGK